MNKFIVAILLILPSINSIGQSLFFDNLRNSTWTSEDFDLSKIKKTKCIELNKLSFPADSLKRDAIIWTFADELRISQYDYQTNKDNTLAIYKYDVDKGRLRIIGDDKETLKYAVTIVSTGNFALLFRKKNKS